MDKNIIGYHIEYSQGEEERIEIRQEDLVSPDQERRDLIKSWAYGLANPWSQSALSYTLNYNGWDNSLNENERWLGQCNSIYYDCLESVIVARGASAQEALTNVEKFMNEIIGKYNENE